MNWRVGDWAISARLGTEGGKYGRPGNKRIIETEIQE